MPSPIGYDRVPALRSLLNLFIAASEKKPEDQPPAAPPPKPASDDAVSACPILSLIEFLKSLSCGRNDCRIVVSRNSADATSAKSGFLKYLLLNPSAQFHDLVKECR